MLARIRSRSADDGATPAGVSGSSWAGASPPWSTTACGTISGIATCGGWRATTSRPTITSDTVAARMARGSRGRVAKRFGADLIGRRRPVASSGAGGWDRMGSAAGRPWAGPPRVWSVRLGEVREGRRERVVVRVHAVAVHGPVGQQPELGVDDVVGRAAAVEEPGGVAELDRELIRQEDVGDAVLLRGRVRGRAVRVEHVARWRRGRRARWPCRTRDRRAVRAGSRLPSRRSCC